MPNWAMIAVVLAVGYVLGVKFPQIAARFIP